MTQNFKLEDIGFYTLEDDRAKNVSTESPLWRCELILTDACNFKCPYCRGIEEEHKGNMSWQDATFIVDMWAAHKLKNIRFSGGEPTLWKGGNKKGLIDLVKYTKAAGVHKIAISTNGSVDLKYYKRLVDAGVNDFSISLDACCADTGDRMAGDKKGAWLKVVNNIKELAKISYVTVGVVFTEENVQDFKDVVKYASNELKVADIRILSSAQWNETFRDIKIDQHILDKHPILKYRMQNYNNGKHVRGLKDEHYNKCPLMLDDMAILNGFHYPCIIYMRELGSPIGKIDKSLSPEDAITKIRDDRKKWAASNNTFEDVICKKNCLDVCIDYNLKVKDLNSNIETYLASPTSSLKGQTILLKQLA